MFSTENRLRRPVFREIGNFGVAEANRRRRQAVIVGTPGVENLHRFLWNEFREIAAGKGLCLRPVGSIFGTITALISHAKFHDSSPAPSPVALETLNRPPTT